MSKTTYENLHPTSMGARAFGIFVALFVNVGIFSLVAFSGGSSTTEPAQAAEISTVFCRYIEEGQLYQMDVPAADWQAAEEVVCGSRFRDIRLGGLLVEGAKLLLANPSTNQILLAQRESCSCSNEDEVPVLQDIGIVEAPRLGAEIRKTALPRILNTPEPSAQNTITTNKTNTPKQKDDKPVKKAPSLDDLLNAANNFDEARPISDVDPGGSADGSRLSKSATGSGDPYLQKVKAKLDNSMNAPASIPKAQLSKLKARANIMIGDGGVLWKWEFTSKSGNPAFDKMVETTLKQFMLSGTMRFSNPPANWKNKLIPIVVDGGSI